MVGGTGRADTPSVYRRGGIEVPDDRNVPECDEEQPRPAMNKPLHGPRKPAMPAVLMTLAVIATLVLVHIFGLTVLVPAE